MSRTHLLLVLGNPVLGHLDKEQVHPVIVSQLRMEGGSQQVSLLHRNNRALRRLSIVLLQLCNNLNLIRLQDLINTRRADKDSGEPPLGILKTFHMKTSLKTLLLCTECVTLDADSKTTQQLLIALEGAARGDVFREEDQTGAGSPGGVCPDKLLKGGPEAGSFRNQSHGGRLSSWDHKRIDFGDLFGITDCDGLGDLRECVEEDDMLSECSLQGYYIWCV